MQELCERKKKQEMRFIQSCFLYLVDRWAFYDFVDTSTKSGVLGFIIGQILCICISKPGEKQHFIIDRVI